MEAVVQQISQAAAIVSAAFYLKDDNFMKNLTYECPDGYIHERSDGAWTNASGTERQYESTAPCPHCGKLAQLKG